VTERRATHRLAVAVLWLSLLAFAASLSLQDIRSFDYWWHLRTGQLIAETGAVPKADPYTFTVPGARWIDIHWLHQLGLYGLHAAGGHAAVVVGKLALVFALLALVAPIGARGGRPLVSVLAMAWMLMAACERFMPRPELTSFVLLAAVLALLDRFERRGDAWVYGIVGVQLVWVNVHGLFALGVALCAMSLVGEVLRPLGSSGGGLRVDRVRRLAAVTALAAVASLANPNGLDGALYPLEQLGMIGPPASRGSFGALNVELVSPLDPRSALTPLALGLFLGLALVSFAALAANFRRAIPSDALAWFAFLYLALSAERNRALFAIVAAPILVRNLNGWLDAQGGESSSLRRVGRAQTAGAALGSLLLLGLGVDVMNNRFFERLGYGREAGLGVNPLYYPEGAAEWIASRRPPGPICHHMADGGYLIWRLYPDYRVMTDGRLEVFGAQRFREVQLGSFESFRAVDRAFRCGVVLLHYTLPDSTLESQPLLWSLHLNTNWRLVFVDDVAAVFVRMGAGGPPYAELDLDAPDLFPALGPAASRQDRTRRIARTRFYMAMRRPAPALEVWAEATERYPDLAKDRRFHARLLAASGAHAESAAMLESLLADAPDDLGLRLQLGDQRLESGDREAARVHYTAILERVPDHPWALHQSAVIAEADGRWDRALALYRRILVVAPPEHPAAQHAAAWLRGERDR
jgi:tetratricopeptide (TPR) repeat protein